MKRHLIGTMQGPNERPHRVTFIADDPEASWRLVPRSVPQTKNSDTTLADDDELFVAVAPNEKYVMKFALFFDTAATPDFKFAITGPSTPTEVLIRGHYVPVGGASDTDFVDTSFGTTHSVTGTGGTTGGFVSGYIYLDVGATGGAVRVQWAQDTSDAADTTLLAGSYIEYFMVPTKLDR